MLSILPTRYKVEKVPSFRKDIDSIGTYIPGRPIEDVMREYGLDDIIKLASNECPEAPFTPVQDAIAAAAADANRYPDTDALELKTISTELPDQASVHDPDASASSIVCRSAAVGCGALSAKKPSCTARSQRS